MVTIFKSLYEKSPKFYDVEYVLEAFRNPKPETVTVIDQLRASKDESERERLKKSLAVVLFSGEFSERKESGLKSYSRFIVLDFDKVNVKIRKQALSVLPYIYAVWISPGGDGLKALVRVASDNHAGHFKALEKEKDLQDLDKSGKDVSRACFVSYDKELYLNTAATIYGKVVESTYTDEQKLEKLKKWLENKGEAFVSGNRNNFLAKLAGACNRFSISRKFVEDYFVREYTGTDFTSREALAVVNSIYTNYADVHGSSSFDDSFSQEEVKDILSAEVVAQDIITVNDVREDLLKDFEEGVKPGQTTYFPTLDEHFRWEAGEVTVMSGVPNGGKSTMLMQLALMQSMFDKVKWGVLSMEQYPPRFFYRELIRTLVGKPIEKGAPGRMSKEEYVRGMEFLQEHVHFIYPQKAEPTPEYTIARFVEGQIKHGWRGVIIDTHGSQAHDKRKSGGRDDIYIGEMINSYKRYALQNNVYFVDVAHSKNVGKDEEGCFKEPAADDLSGGMAWYARTDNMLIYHRPGMPIIYSDACTLKSVKIKKQQVNGVPGLTNFNYRRDIGRFFDNGYNPLMELVL